MISNVLYFQGVTSEFGSSQQQQRQGGGPANRPRGPPPGATGSGQQQGQSSDPQAPPAEEKTWWQKNWMLVCGVAMAVLNIMGNLSKQSQQPAAGAARAARS